MSADGRCYGPAAIGWIGWIGWPQVAQLHKAEAQLKEAMKANEQLVSDRDRTLSEGEKLRRQIEDLVRQNEIQRGKNAEELERLQAELVDSQKHIREIIASAGPLRSAPAWRPMVAFGCLPGAAPSRQVVPIGVRRTDRKVQEERDKMLRDAAQFKALVAEFDSFKKSAERNSDCFY